MAEPRPTRATAENWMFPPADGWTYDRVRDLDVPFEWELVAGRIVPRGQTKLWHDQVRNEVYFRLRSARRPPYSVAAERCVMISPDTVLKPDVVVYDKTGEDVFTQDCTPATKVRLVVEVVSPGTRMEDRFVKPALFAEARIPHYWRVERDSDDLPRVHEFWWHHEAGTFAPAPDRAAHVGKLRTDVPFPVEIDLRGLVEL
ncbi:Uma2 family endonuclease [Streptomyces sp. 4N509B]|uniref:Uma2 family endonuclease n=1 Tax=Streptomyces sp. 4N509B TaxID=3457413 RepID=UPI003FD07434